MRKRLVVMVLTLLVSGGCAPEIETPALEDMGMIGVMGFDYVDGHRMKVTVSMPMPTQGAKEKTQVFTAVSKLPSESLISLSTKTDRTMVFSQLRVVLVGEELARKSGLQKLVIDLYRNPAVGDNVFIAVVKQTAEEVISGKYPDKPEINSYLNNLLRPRRETAFEPFTTLHDYIFTSTNEVSDPSLPYLEKRGGEIVVSNVAVFKGHKMIGKLTEREGKIVQTILGRNMLPKMSFMIKEKSGKKATIVFDFVRSHSKVKSNGNLQQPKITIRIRSRGTVLGYTGERDLENSKELKIIRHQLQSVMEEEMHDLLKKFQKQGIDPAALEESLRSAYRGKWTREKGLAALKKVKFDIEFDVDFTGFGTLK